MRLPFPREDLPLELLDPREELHGHGEVGELAPEFRGALLDRPAVHLDAADRPRDPHVEVPADETRRDDAEHRPVGDRHDAVEAKGRVEGDEGRAEDSAEDVRLEPRLRRPYVRQDPEILPRDVGESPSDHQDRARDAEGPADGSGRPERPVRGRVGTHPKRSRVVGTTVELKQHNQDGDHRGGSRRREDADRSPGQVPGSRAGLEHTPNLGPLRDAAALVHLPPASDLGESRPLPTDSSPGFRGSVGIFGI